MSFDFTAWKGPRSVAKIKADHAAQDARDRLAVEAREAATANAAAIVREAASDNHAGVLRKAA